MRAVVVEEHGRRPEVRELPDPVPDPDGVVVRVEATGVCRSDWHAWHGHDPDVVLPFVPGHELAGVVEAVGSRVVRWRPGDRVTVPFVCACGRCAACTAGEQQVCERQEQPGFTHDGSFAELVALHAADVNLVALPDDLAYDAAAGLGCRVATAFRAVADVGRVAAGEQVAVVGCGGVGLAAVQVAVAAGARVVAVDVQPAALALATASGAAAVVDASAVDDPAAAVRDLTGGGADLALDALGSGGTAATAIGALRRRGRHVQVGLIAPGEVLPGAALARVVALELAVLGSHGMPAHDYPRLLRLVASGAVRPGALVTSRTGLDGVADALAALDLGSPPGVTVVEPQRR